MPIVLPEERPVYIRRFKETGEFTPGSRSAPTQHTWLKGHCQCAYHPAAKHYRPTRWLRVEALAIVFKSLVLTSLPCLSVSSLLTLISWDILVAFILASVVVVCSVFKVVDEHDAIAGFAGAQMLKRIVSLSHGKELHHGSYHESGWIPVKPCTSPSPSYARAA